MTKIVQIRVSRMTESCQRTTYAVDLISDENFIMTACAHRTGSLYTNFEGLSVEEARDRALIDAADWGDFLDIEPLPYSEDGVVIEPQFLMKRYNTRRLLNKRNIDVSN